ncbi:MAG: hypothetical protein AAF664_00475 [Planctomycetota bacterium]
MINRFRRTWPLALYLMLSITLAQGVCGQKTGSSNPGLHIDKSASVKVMATRVRMVGQIKASDSDARRALETLRELKEKARQKLIALKADESSIEFGDTVISGLAGNDSRLQMMMEMGMGGEMEADSDESQLPLEAQATVSADWVIPESDNDAQILFIKRLQEKVAEVDVVGEQDGANITEVQAEKLEQYARMAQQYGMESNSQGTIFRFVGSITAEQKQSAMRKAADESAEDADALASAMGLKRGPVISVSASSSDLSIDYYQDRSLDFPVESDEVASENPSTLTYTVKLVTTFEIL